MASNADNFPNNSETLPASVQQFHNSLFDDQNLTHDNFRPSIVSTTTNSDHEVSIFEQIDDSCEESFEKRVAHGLQRLAPLIDRFVQVSLGKCITFYTSIFHYHYAFLLHYVPFNSYKMYFHLHKSTDEHSKA